MSACLATTSWQQAAACAYQFISWNFKLPDERLLFKGAGFMTPFLLVWNREGGHFGLWRPKECTWPSGIYLPPDYPLIFGVLHPTLSSLSALETEIRNHQKFNIPTFPFSRCGAVVFLSCVVFSISFLLIRSQVLGKDGNIERYLTSPNQCQNPQSKRYAFNWIAQTILHSSMFIQKLTTPQARSFASNTNQLHLFSPKHDN